jgi:hypothetical protein
VNLRAASVGQVDVFPLQKVRHPNREMSCRSENSWPWFLLFLGLISQKCLDIYSGAHTGKGDMIKVRTMKHIASSRTIQSFRAYRTISRAHQGIILDQGRMMLGYAQILNNDAHRKWRNGLWQLRR